MRESLNVFISTFFYFDLVLQELDSHFTASLSPTNRDPLPLSAWLCPELADYHPLLILLLSISISIFNFNNFGKSYIVHCMPSPFGQKKSTDVTYMKDTNTRTIHNKNHITNEQLLDQSGSSILFRFFSKEVSKF